MLSVVMPPPPHPVSMSLTHIRIQCLPVTRTDTLTLICYLFKIQLCICAVNGDVATSRGRLRCCVVRHTVVLFQVAEGNAG